MKGLPSVLFQTENLPDSLVRQLETAHEYWTALWRCAAQHCQQIKHLMTEKTSNDPYFTAQCNALPHAPKLHEVKIIVFLQFCNENCNVYSEHC